MKLLMQKSARSPDKLLLLDHYPFVKIFHDFSRQHISSSWSIALMTPMDFVLLPLASKSHKENPFSVEQKKITFPSSFSSFFSQFRTKSTSFLYYLFSVVEKRFVLICRDALEKQNAKNTRPRRDGTGQENLKHSKRKENARKIQLPNVCLCLVFPSACCNAMLVGAHFIGEQNNNVSAERPATERIKSTLQTVFCVVVYFSI